MAALSLLTPLAAQATLAAQPTLAAHATLATRSNGLQPAGTYIVDQWGLLVALAMILVAAAISWALRLEVSKSLLFSAARAALQLFAMALIIQWVIQQNNVIIVFSLVALMIVGGVQITISRAKGIPHGMALPVFLTLLITTLLIMGILVEAVIRPRPWYSPQVVIPITGMILGNTVSATAVAMSRFYESMRSRADEIDMMLALGATPWEASRTSVLSAIRLGMLPTVATLASSGLVLIPGMMAGQVIAGLDPRGAAAYQLVILYALASLTLTSASLILLLIYKTSFTSRDQYISVTSDSRVSVFGNLKPRS